MEWALISSVTFGRAVSVYDFQASTINAPGHFGFLMAQLFFSFSPVWQHPVKNSPEFRGVVMFV
jgi:hypothetical protein